MLKIKNFFNKKAKIVVIWSVGKIRVIKQSGNFILQERGYFPWIWKNIKDKVYKDPYKAVRFAQDTLNSIFV